MDFFSRRRLGISLALLFGLSAIAMAVDAFPPLVNWAAPSTYTPARSSGARTLGDITNAMPFIGVTPCRQFDIRPGTLADNTPMAITLTGAPCGLPVGAVAVSLNITVFSIVAGANGVFKVGTANPPTTAWINYPPTESQRGNAGVLPLSAGVIWVEVSQGGGSVQLTVDVNGYYAQVPATSTDALIFENTGAVTIAGGNHSTASNAAGVLGEMISNTPGGSSAGVRGINDGTGGNGIGVWGSHAGSGDGGLFTSVNGAGVVGVSTGTTGVGALFLSVGGIGVEGVSVATTGVHQGIYGETDSTSEFSSGVEGTVQGGLPINHFSTFGVLGNNLSGLWGVLGTSLTRGTQGSRVDTNGVFLTGGVCGYTGTSGLFSFNTIDAVGAKNFVVPHPSDASKQIVFTSLEGNEVGTYFRGRGRFVNGRAIISVPQEFQMVTEDDGLTVQITPIGRMAQVGVVSMDLYHIVAESSRDVDFSYLVQGVRRGYASSKSIQDNIYFVPDSPNMRMEPYPQQIKDTLIRLGIYNADGTVNMDTAERMGWAQKWRDEAASAKAAAQARSATAATLLQQQ